MRSQRGQATVEWIGLVLLAALSLAALARLAPRADDEALGATLAQSITRPATPPPSRRSPVARPAPTSPRSRLAEIGSGTGSRSLPPAARAVTAPPLVPPPAQPTPLPRVPPLPRLPPLVPLPIDPGPLPHLRPPDRRALLRSARRRAGSAWRRAWYACLVYERFRWALLHPESRFPGYTMPPAEVLRIANDCISPLDLVRDWPMLTGRAGAP